jgi:hypothetical protein
MADAEKKYTTPISESDWQGIKIGEGIQDSSGRIWRVTRLSKRLNHLYADCPGHGEERLEWKNGQILDAEEWSIVMELNHPSVTIVRA